MIAITIIALNVPLITESDSTSKPSLQLTNVITELLKGLSDMIQELNKATTDRVDVLLGADLKDMQPVELDRFLDALSFRSNEPAEKKVRFIMKETRDLLGEYDTALSKKNTRQLYEPFRKLANRILELLHQGEDQVVSPATFTRNAPCFIHGHYKTLQSPDVVLVGNDGALFIIDSDRFVPLDSTEPGGKGGRGKDGPEDENEDDGNAEAGVKTDNNKPNDGELSWIDTLCIFELREVDSKKEPTTWKQSERGQKLTPVIPSSLNPGRNSAVGPSKRKGDESLSGPAEKKAKESYEGSYEDYMTRLARSCVYKFSSTFHRRHHSFSALVLGSTLLMTYHDRGGAIRSRELDFTSDRPQFIDLISVLASLHPRELGFLTAAELEGRPVMVLRQLVGKRSLGLIGRGREVLCAKIIGSPQDSDFIENMALKADWQLTRRKREWDLIAGARGGLNNVVAERKPPGTDKSLPSVYLHAQLDKILDEDPFSRQIGIAESFHKDSNRNRNVMALESLDMHLHEVEDEMNFRKCFREIFHAHYWVYKTTGILHRDISTQTLMVRKSHDGTMTGVLMDWDLADYERNAETESRTGMRTGTRTFMAHELLEHDPPVHELRFDWESFLYYLLWVAFVLIDRKLKEEEIQRLDNEGTKPEDMGSQLENWPSLPNNQLRHAKRYALIGPTMRLWKNSPHKFGSTFEDWIQPMGSLFQQGVVAATGEMLVGEDYETIGGILTHDKFSSIVGN